MVDEKQGKDEKDLFFVEVKQSNDVKRNILEAQRDLVETLQRCENIKFLRTKRFEKVDELKAEIKELSKMIANLKNALPKKKLRAIHKKAEPKKKKKRKRKGKKRSVKAKVEKPIQEMTELQKLEAELGAIESKLSTLK